MDGDKTNHQSGLAENDEEGCKPPARPEDRQTRPALSGSIYWHRSASFE